MIKALSYTLRMLRQAPLQSAIAIAGLLLGWSCFLSITIFLYRELTYDRFNTKSDRIYRIVYNEKTAEIPGQRHMGTVGPTVAPALKDISPEIESFTRFRYSPDWVVSVGNRRFYEHGVWYADTAVFGIFDFPLIRGQASTALQLPNSVVITKDIARKYFGGEDALGKNLTMNNTIYQVTGVLAEIPSNSHLRFDFLLPFQSFRIPYGYPVTLEDWGWIAFHNYILVRPNTNIPALQSRLAALAGRHFSPNSLKKFRLELQPLNQIYFGDAKDENIPTGNSTYLLVLASAAFLIILAASFNFANLFSAMSIARAKEAGIRRMLGAGKFAIAWNISRMALLLVFFTLLLALALLPLWTRFAPWSVSNVPLPLQAWIIGSLGLLLLAAFIALASGAYPSLLLSGLRFSNLLKGAFKVGQTGTVLRKALLAGQFVVSLSLMCSVVVISRQMAYLFSVDPGYAKDQLLLIHMPGESLARDYPSLKQRLLANPQIRGVTAGGGRLDGSNGTVPIIAENTAPGGEPMNIMSVSFDFFATTGIRLIEGHEFTGGHPGDTTQGVILNESAAKALGWRPGTAIGKRIRIDNILTDGRVMAIVKDFNFSSLHDPITPLVLYYPKSRVEDVYVRFSGGTNLPAVISSINRDWDAVAPSLPFDFTLMSDHLAGLYREDAVFEKMFGFFSIIAVLIACLGFYGLLSQDILYRIKEIAVRKLLGAGIPSITRLLLNNYLRLFAVAALIGWPLSFYVMHKWLDEFPYRLSIPWYLFPVAGAALLLLSILSVTWLIFRAANANPVKALKT